MIAEWSEFRALVLPYAAALIEPGPLVTIHAVYPTAGFRTFVRAIHAVIEPAGPGAHYLFDNLSHLAEVWISDIALGNFYRLTCPRLWQMETVTYFAIRRARHSDRGLGPVLRTNPVHARYRAGG